MKREILFTGQLSYSKTWVKGNLIEDRSGNKYIIPFNVFEPDGHHLIIDSDSSFRVDPETVGQFTGMIDKNGTKIFEGDIYNMGDDNIRYVVVWRNCMFMGKQIGSSSYAGLDYFESDIKKVGNIYDNPELLNR